MSNIVDISVFQRKRVEKYCNYLEAIDKLEHALTNVALARQVLSEKRKEIDEKAAVLDLLERKCMEQLRLIQDDINGKNRFPIANAKAKEEG